MGGFSAQVQQPTNPSEGKGFAQQAAQQQQPQAPQPMAKGGNYQSNATSGQPRMGQQNPYPNTVGQWDNAQIQPVKQQGKGKGV
jgi:hypothetical protein